MKTAHTPGPWQVGNFEPKAVFTCDTEGPQRVANCLKNLADARLIATSPELFSELIDFHDHAIDQGWHDCDAIPGGCPVMNVLIKATKRT